MSLLVPVGRIGHPREVKSRTLLASAISTRSGFVRCQHAGALPSPKPLPTEKDETNPISFSSLIWCWHRLSDLKQRLVIWWVVRTLCSSRCSRT
jgi:hypothetical protein